MTETGALPTTARALAPDLARGGMLLLIALANVHLWVYGHSLGPRGYPLDVGGVDRAVALLQMTFVDGRAYPLFGLLFGYGIGQLTRRRAAGGEAAADTVALVRRRGGWMVALGLVHGVLLWSGDIVGAYGVLGVLLAGLLVHGSDRALRTVSVVGVVLVGLLYAGSGFTLLPGDPQAFLASMTMADPVAALATRAVEWLLLGPLLQGLSVFGAVAFGVWAARRGILDDPARHLVLLRRTAALGIPVAVLSGLPLALMAAQLWTSPPVAAVALAGTVHAVGGYAGGLGYAAAFGLLAVRIGGAPGPFARAVQACGQRSLSCYLAQSVAFAALLPAWTLGLGDGAHLWQAALVAVGAWLVILAVAATTSSRGPAELLLRRLTYRTLPART